MSTVLTRPGIPRAPLNAEIHYRRWLGVPAFWLAWLATTLVLHIDPTANPPWKIWPWVVIAAVLVAGADMQLIRPVHRCEDLTGRHPPRCPKPALVRD